ncbi:MAG TPA: FecR domain-containing protein [Polyangiaceae bacterium]
MTRSESTESTESHRLAPLVELLRTAAEQPSPVELERGLNLLRAHEARRRVARPVASRKRLLAAAALSLLVSGGVLVPRLLERSRIVETPVVVTRVEGGRMLEGGYLSEVGDAGMRLSFSDGSRFVLEPGTRGRLRSLGAEGARMALDHGTASFQIVRNPNRSWWVEAGPFSISVRGTEFTVSWDPTSERFDVQLRQGQVAVSGPLLGDELTLRPGQNLSVSLAKGETVISEGRGENPAGPAPSRVSPDAAVSPPPSAPAGAEPAAPSLAASASRPPESGRGFREALANGQWDRILADVDREGVETSLRTLSSDELFALADAARYRRRPSLARSALLAQRERFPSSPRALDALFLLGRVEEMHAGGKPSAVERYDEYLARAPGGTYAAEALGRKLILVKEAQGPERARQVAEEYLRRFPTGSYAEVARGLARAP